MSSARTSLDNAESNAGIEKANIIVNRFNNAPFHIVEARKEFDTKITEFAEAGLSQTSATRHKPSDIVTEVEAQLTFLRKLKFHYLEQNAKDKYIKTIVDDDPEPVTVEDNEHLRKSNEEKKVRLKQAKERLGKRYKDVSDAAAAVENRYEAARALIDEFNTLTTQILDSRLALSRLRTSHPSPRLSVASAKATLEAQTETMAALDAQLSETASKVDRLKERVQDVAREAERTKIERAAKEEEVRQTKTEEEDERIAGLYEWYNASLALHRSLFSLVSTESVSKNALALTYCIVSNGGSEDKAGIPLTLTLLFHPNTRILADASVSSSDTRIAGMNLNDLVGSHVQNNDVVGLVRGIMARVKCTLRDTRPR